MLLHQERALLSSTGKDVADVCSGEVAECNPGLPLALASRRGTLCRTDGNPGLLCAAGLGLAGRGALIRLSLEHAWQQDTITFLPCMTGLLPDFTARRSVAGSCCEDGIQQLAMLAPQTVHIVLTSAGGQVA